MMENFDFSDFLDDFLAFMFYVFAGAFILVGLAFLAFLALIVLTGLSFVAFLFL
jgi:hypothetical protein